MSAAKKDDSATLRLAKGSAVSVCGLTRRYCVSSGPELVALDRVDLNIPAGQVVAVCGTSGSGKSTLLHLIGAMDPPDSGSVAVDGAEVTTMSRRDLVAYRRRVGFVFQRFHLIAALTALDNVLAPVMPYRTAFDKRDRARELLAAVGLGDRTDALPSQLSGGQQQRVAIARALVNGPSLLLADEPTGNLDSATGTEIVDLLLRLRTESGLTILIATHDRELAGRCDRVIDLRDGRMLADHSAQPDNSDEFAAGSS